MRKNNKKGGALMRGQLLLYTKIGGYYRLNGKLGSVNAYDAMTNRSCGFLRRERKRQIRY